SSISTSPPPRSNKNVKVDSPLVLANGTTTESPNTWTIPGSQLCPWLCSTSPLNSITPSAKRTKSAGKCSRGPSANSSDSPTISHIVRTTPPCGSSAIVSRSLPSLCDPAPPPGWCGHVLHRHVCMHGSHPCSLHTATTHVEPQNPATRNPAASALAA